MDPCRYYEQFCGIKAASLAEILSHDDSRLGCPRYLAGWGSLAAFLPSSSSSSLRVTRVSSRKERRINREAYPGRKSESGSCRAYTFNVVYRHRRAARSSRCSNDYETGTIDRGGEACRERRNKDRGENCRRNGNGREGGETFMMQIPGTFDCADGNQRQRIASCLAKLERGDS